MCGFYALTALGSIPAALNDQPELLAVTTGIAALSWYNFAYATRHNPDRKFGTNFIGPNAIAAGAVLAIILPDVLYSTAHTHFSLLASPKELGVRERW
ncbi:MAG: hypothetical protein HLUCCA01_11470 [Bacteroidetes bacterium HLUCCA01]|nr:MAG: hypothetical protein HLUCCA01_11470 [Bacteroidetes bacterium HLUCCA01]